MVGFIANPPSVTLRVIAVSWAPRVMLAGEVLVDGVDYLAQPETAGTGGWITILRPLWTGALVDIDLQPRRAGAVTITLAIATPFVRCGR